MQSTNLFLGDGMYSDSEDESNSGGAGPVEKCHLHEFVQAVIVRSACMPDTFETALFLAPGGLPHLFLAISGLLLPESDILIL